jgi:cytochrome c oxidase subunit II
MKRVAITLFAALMLGTGCVPVVPSSPSIAPTTPFFLDSAGPIAAREADLFRLLLYPSAVVLVVVWGLLIYNLIRFRKKPTDKEIAPQYYREELVEAIYTAIPILLVAGIFIVMLGAVRAVAAPAPQAGDLQVTIRGHQWWWEFQYPGYKVFTANELHIPVNTTVQINLDSADVIHSFYVPQLAGKTDVVPGVINHMWLRADKIGKFHGQCAEFCGLNHANMRFTVFVDSPADFQAWITNQQKPAVEPQTDQQKTGHDIIAEGVCAACHNLDDNGPEFNPSAPNLTHLMSRTTFAGGMFDLNEANLRRWLQDTQAMKPGNDMKHKFANSQINDLVSYLLTLK